MRGDASRVSCTRAGLCCCSVMLIDMPAKVCCPFRGPPDQWGSPLLHRVAVAWSCSLCHSGSVSLSLSGLACPFRSFLSAPEQEIGRWVPHAGGSFMPGPRPAAAAVAGLASVATGSLTLRLPSRGTLAHRNRCTSHTHLRVRPTGVSAGSRDGRRQTQARHKWCALSGGAELKCMQRRAHLWLGAVAFGWWRWAAHARRLSECRSGLEHKRRQHCISA